MERVGGFGGKADQLNAYYTQTGNPDYFAEDLARYRALSPSDVQAAVRQFLPTGPARRADGGAGEIEPVGRHWQPTHLPTDHLELRQIDNCRWTSAK